MARTKVADSEFWRPVCKAGAEFAIVERKALSSPLLEARSLPPARKRRSGFVRSLSELGF